MKASVTLRAPAKLNLSLEVLDRRPSGLHALRSVMVPVDLCDEIAVTLEPQGTSVVTIACDSAALQRDNLIERAWHALGLNRGAQIQLRKKIPMQAGLGGGSSDAAAILLASQRGDFGDLRPIDYLSLASELGSDVPFFLVQTAALLEGTGERVTALGHVPEWHAIIVKPPVAISTAEAYAALDERPRPSRGRNSSVSLHLGEALQRADFERVTELLQNDFLEIAAATPEIARGLEMLRSAGARNPSMSGSGSAVFALASSRREAKSIAEKIRLPQNFEMFQCALWSADAWMR